MEFLLSFSSVLNYAFYIIIAVIVLLFMVTIHEFGHYIAGKKLGFKITEFSIGFGKAIFQKTNKQGELFSIRIFPLGGYCAFVGEETEGSESGQDDFNSQPPWKRLIVLFSGAFFNFLSAIIFSFILLVSYGYDIPQVVEPVATYDINTAFSFIENEIVNGDQITSIIYGEDELYDANTDLTLSVFTDIEIGEYLTISVERTVNNSLETVEVLVQIINNSTSVQNQLTAGDVIYTINGYDIDFVNDQFYATILADDSIGDNTTVIVKRDGELIELENVNVFLTIGSSGYVGNSMGVDLTAYRFTFIETLVECVPFTLKWCWKVLLILWTLITGGLALTSVGGPITTITIMATYTQASFSYFLLLLPLLATNLAVFNLIPLPALDGGQMLFTTIEWIRGKPINRKIINILNNIALLFLLGFVVLVDFLHFLS